MNKLISPRRYRRFRKGCMNKIFHPTEQEAEWHFLSLVIQGKASAATGGYYKCLWCSGWHATGNLNPRPKNR